MQTLIVVAVDILMLTCGISAHLSSSVMNAGGNCISHHSVENML